MTESYKGTCFCGAVEIEATGAPFTMGYCHCNDCRAWSAGPVTAYTLWQRDAVKVTKGEEFLSSYSKTGTCHRKTCTQCGGSVMADNTGGDFTDVFAAILPTLEFKPDAHVYYSAAVISIKDGLPKFSDFPAEVGGSGEMLPE